MTIDWWGLGLQAVNVLILVWLLARVFWRPVAGAIAKRQEVAQGMMDEAKAAKAKADAALAEVTETRAGIAAERETLLAAARAKVGHRRRGSAGRCAEQGRGAPGHSTHHHRARHGCSNQGKRGAGLRAIGGHRRQALGPAEHAHGSGSIPRPAGRGHRPDACGRPRGAGRQQQLISRSSPPPTRRTPTRRRSKKRSSAHWVVLPS